MLPLFFAALQPFVPAEHGLFEAAGLCLVRVTATEVPDHPKLYGPTLLRVDKVLIGPRNLKGISAVYEFFTPKWELNEFTGARYSGEYPDFAYPAPKGQSRYWWACPDGKGGWTTASFFKVHKFVPVRYTELLLKADLKPDSKEEADRAELVKALVKLESHRTLIEQFAFLREMKKSQTAAVSAAADRTLQTLTSPPKGKRKWQPALPPK